MVEVLFRNVERSELARQLAEDRISEIVRAFPDAPTRAVSITLGMVRSSQVSRPDLFAVHVQWNGAFGTIAAQAQAPSLYVALELLQRSLRRKLKKASESCIVNNDAT